MYQNVEKNILQNYLQKTNINCNGDYSEVNILHRKGFQRFQINASKRSGIKKKELVDKLGADGIRKVARLLPNAEFIIQNILQIQLMKKVPYFLLHI
tara:strand:- start:518 stop:808 length:291 start_codon:yes stop_codon:yes gene_type:complete